MFGFLIVYPAAFLIGLLCGSVAKAKTGREQAIIAAAAGVAGALIAAGGSMGFLGPDVSVAELLSQLTLPAAAICFVLGFIGTYLGAFLRNLLKRIATFVIETIRL